MRSLGKCTSLVLAGVLLVPAAAQAGNEAAPWSAPTYLSSSGIEQAEDPSLGMLSDGSLVATWAQYDDGWFPELASEPFAGSWSSPEAISSTAISAPLDAIGGVRTAVAGDGKFVSAWLAPSTNEGDDVDGAVGSVKPGDPPSSSPYTFAANTASNGGFLYGGLTPEVSMSSDGNGSVEYTAASATESGGTYVGLTAINGGEPADTTQGESTAYEYNPGVYTSTDFSAFDPELASPAPLNQAWEASTSDEQALVSPAPNGGSAAQVYATADPSDWDGVTPVTPSGLTGLDASAAVLAGGQTLVASAYSGLQIWESGQAEATTVADASDAGGRPAIAAYNDGSATIAYLAVDADTNTDTVEAITVAPDGTLSAPVPLSPSGITVSSLKVAYGPDGTTYVVWASSDTDDSAYDGIFASARLPGGSFPSIPDTVFAGAVADPQIEVDQTGYATIVAEVFDSGVGYRIAAFTHANAAPPRDLTLPTISLSGTTLSCAHGTWANQPTVYRYEWLRNGSAIGGQTASTYKLTTADASTQLSCRVTATNSYGSGMATSSALKVSAATPSHVTTGKVTNSNGTVTVTISCSASSSSCAPVTISLSVVEELTGSKLTGVIARAGKKKHKRTVVIAKLTVTLKPGQHKTVKLTLNGKGKALLKSRHKFPAKLTLVSGKSTLKSKKLTLATKKKKSKKRHK